ncbi:MAG TPA: glycoside hydrolase family protein [Terriglobia bacterium]|nr:glycoside hydrolase family protein [Terriglobia bacterium]
MDLIARCLTDLKRHEGFRQFPYRDTRGILTIGYGRNLESRGITAEEASYLLENDILRAVKSLRERLSGFAQLGPARQAVLVNMAVNLGVNGLLGFRKTLAAIEVGDYAEAAREMLRSRWAEQVPARARELAKLMEGGNLK